MHVSIFIHPLICMKFQSEIANCRSAQMTMLMINQQIKKLQFQTLNTIHLYVLASAFINIYKESRWNAHAQHTSTSHYVRIWYTFVYVMCYSIQHSHKQFSTKCNLVDFCEDLSFFFTISLCITHAVFFFFHVFISNFYLLFN